MKEYLHDAFELVGENKVLQRLLKLCILLAGIYIALPFCVVYARVKLALPAKQIGIFITLQILRETVSGLGWDYLGESYRYPLVIIGVALNSCDFATKNSITACIYE